MTRLNKRKMDYRGLLVNARIHQCRVHGKTYNNGKGEDIGRLANGALDVSLGRSPPVVAHLETLQRLSGRDMCSVLEI